MAGSLAHIIKEDGRFWMDLIENLGDAHEALEECFALILALSGGDMGKVSGACDRLGFVDPYETDRLEDEPMPDPMRRG